MPHDEEVGICAAQVAIAQHTERVPEAHPRGRWTNETTAHSGRR
jgi:hypothetical protein